MTANDVYEIIKSFSPETHESTLCDLHRPCSNNNHRCARPQKKLMLDFDAIKTAWCKIERICSKSSVDGFLCKENKIYFVEIKGAQNFISNQFNLCHSDKERNEKINDQQEKYTNSLKNKIVDSLFICEQIIGGSCFLEGLQIKYVLVTDIDSRSNPLEVLNDQLNYLSEFSSKNWGRKYVESLGKTFDEVTKSFDNISTYYVFCEEFDKIINS